MKHKVRNTEAKLKAEEMLKRGTELLARAEV